LIGRLNPLRLIRRLRRPETPARPLSSLQVELTNHCNYKCTFCPQSIWKDPHHAGNSFDRPKGFMEYDLFRRVIDEANEIAAEVNFSYFGEPMMHPEFLKYMDYLKQRNPKLGVVMNTNLSYATRDIFAKLIEIGLTNLRLSIDAATAATYDLVRPGQHYIDLEGTTRSGDRFETICRKVEYWFSLPDHRPTRHVFTVNSRNVHEGKPYVERWLPYLGREDIILTKNVLTYGGKMTDALIRSNPCNVWNLNMLTVGWNGRVTPCNLDTNMELTIGRIQEHSLLKLFKGAQYERIEALSKSRSIIPCNTCVDANNWTKNIIFHQGDSWNDAPYRIYEDNDDRQVEGITLGR
jgi:radical SAM protein with 4Fe4S-binding SPASM domain